METAVSLFESVDTFFHTSLLFLCRGFQLHSSDNHELWGLYYAPVKQTHSKFPTLESNKLHHAPDFRFTVRKI